MNFTLTLIVIVGRQWFDKRNGNTYFCALIIAHGREGRKSKTVEHMLPFQAGYGEHYVDMAARWLDEEGLTFRKKHTNGATEPLWSYCRDHGIALVQTISYVATRKELQQ